MKFVYNANRMTFTVWLSYHESTVYSLDYLSSSAFLSWTSAVGPPRDVTEQWIWQLKRRRKVIGAGVESCYEDALRKAVALGWPKPNVVYFDRYKQMHTPLPEDPEDL